MKEKKYNYFRFLLSLMQGYFDNPIHTLSKIFDYVVLEIIEMAREKHNLDAITDIFDVNGCVSEKMHFAIIDLVGPEKYKDIYIRAGNLEDLLKLHQQHFESNRTNYKDDIKMNVKLDHLITFNDIVFKNIENKKYESFAIFLAAKSVKGERDYVKTNFKHLLARAFGYRSISYVPGNILRSNKWKHLSGRYARERLLKALQRDWHMIYYSNYHRGFFIANELYGMKNLIRGAEGSKIKNRNRAMKMEKNTLRKEVFQEMESDILCNKQETNVQSFTSTIQSSFDTTFKPTP
jgi:hypothetical protein